MYKCVMRMYNLCALNLKNHSYTILKEVQCILNKYTNEFKLKIAF